MSMGHVLLAVETRLIVKLEATPLSMTSAAAHCSIQPDGWPPKTAHEWYVAIDEQKVTAVGQNEDQIQEVFDISIWVCRRVGQVPMDYRKLMLLWQDPYRDTETANMSPERVERQVIAGVHLGWDIVDEANDNNLDGPLGTSVFGDKFTMPLFYKGRGSLTQEQQPGESGFWARKQLNFSGMLRTQAMDILA